MPQPDLLPRPDDLCDTCACPRRDHPVRHRGGFVCGFRDRPDGRPWRPHEVRGDAARIDATSPEPGASSTDAPSAGVPSAGSAKPAAEPSGTEPFVSNDELVLPLEGRSAGEWTPALEAVALEVLGPDAADWWGTPSPATWDAPPRALLSSLPGARRVRQVLLAWLRSDHGVYS